MIALFLMAQSVQTLAPGIAQAVPATRFACEMTAGDGSRFTIAGTTPLFPKGWDPNRANYVAIESSHAEAFKGKVGIDPGEAGDWFRDFQVSDVTKAGVSYTLRLMLRREGNSAAIATRYESTGKQIPYEYYAAGLCKADFAPSAAPVERGS
jgi:hypothetical protein